ncbi:hypothetical protein [Xaviernesmea oryzae]|uniref:hypothetical protein n=1 Tax=Xaviernesmea oryzae TaxID=464029 RepID=UPI0008D32678|nr:hypothetical protein [Xaviernesmea oryzae]SEM27265.1 hypothetical protein SAMN04487976_12616 [Xaviernesmea oryzae]
MHLALLVIITRLPHVDRVALEVQDIECRRVGLSDLKRCWIVVGEYNYDIAQRSFYIDTHVNLRGRFQQGLHDTCRDGVRGLRPSRGPPRQLT